MAGSDTPSAGVPRRDESGSRSVSPAAEASDTPVDYTPPNLYPGGNPKDRSAAKPAVSVGVVRKAPKLQENLKGLLNFIENAPTNLEFRTNKSGKGAEALF